MRLAWSLDQQACVHRVCGTLLDCVVALHGAESHRVVHEPHTVVADARLHALLTCRPSASLPPRSCPGCADLAGGDLTSRAPDLHNDV